MYKEISSFLKDNLKTYSFNIINKKSKVLIVVNT